MQVKGNDAISLNAMMIITEEKIISNIYKVKKLISPNSKRQIIKLEDDAYFKDLVESITSYLKEYPNKKNFPQDVYKEAYDLVEYATEEFARNNRKVEELITKREQNIKQAMLLKEAYNTVSEKEEGWIDNLGRYEGRFSKKIAESLTVIANEGNKTEEEIQEAKTTITSKISNLESNLFIQIDLERIEDRTKALSYIGIEVAESLRQIPAPVDTEKLSKEEKEILEREIQKEKEELELQKIEAEKKKEQERIAKEEAERLAREQEEDSSKVDESIIENKQVYAGTYNVISYNELPDTNQTISFAQPITQMDNAFGVVETTNEDLENFNIVFKKPQMQNVQTQTYNISKNIEANEFAQMIAEDMPKIQNIQNTIVESSNSGYNEISLDPIIEMEKLRKEIVTSPIIENYIDNSIVESGMTDKNDVAENNVGNNVQADLIDDSDEEFKIVFKNKEQNGNTPIKIILKDEEVENTLSNVEEKTEEVEVSKIEEVDKKESNFNEIDDFIEDRTEDITEEIAEKNTTFDSQAEVLNVLEGKKAEVLEELVEEKEDVIPNTNAYNLSNIVSGEALADDILNAFSNTEKIAIDEDIYNLKGHSNFGKEIEETNEQVEDIVKNDELETTENNMENTSDDDFKITDDLLEHVDVFAKLLGKDVKDAKLQKENDENISEDTIVEKEVVKIQRIVPDSYEEKEYDLDEDEQELIDNYGRDEYYAKKEEQTKDTDKIIEDTMFKNEEEKKAFFNGSNLAKKENSKGIFSKIKRGIASIFSSRVHEEPEYNN